MDKLKKSVRITKLAELEEELKIYINECRRLRHVLDEVMQN